MEEFSSISVSSYEAASLTEQLNEQAAGGWDVVAIVSAGSNVVAYLSRPADSAPTADTSSSQPDNSSIGSGARGDDDSASTGIPIPASVPSMATTDDLPPSSPASTAPTSDARDNGAAARASLADLAADSESSSTSSSASPSAGSSHASVAPTSVASTAPASNAAAAPAGWYADPSSRYELRYWDGGQWTEHVSRAGQQYTDPPVA